MLKRVYIENFLSFDKFEMSFEKINILVGKNNSGKSNFCHTLQFLRLSQEVGNLYEAYERAVGPNSRTTNFNTKKNISKFEIECELPFKTNGFKRLTYIYSLTVRHHKKAKRRNAAFEIESESLTMKGLQSKCVILLENERGHARVLRETNVLSGKPPILKDYVVETIDSSKTMLREIVDSKEHTLANNFKKFLSYIALYDFQIDVMRSDVNYSAHNLIGPKGERITSTLYWMYKEHKAIFKGFEQTLKGIDNNITRVDFDQQLLEQRSWCVPRFYNKNGEMFFMDSVSDGTVRFIALFCLSVLSEALGVADGFEKTYFIEEPETGMHVGLLRLLYDIYKDSKGQFVFTTHSPYLIDLFDDALDGIKVFDKGDGGNTTLRALDKKKINKLLETLPLGEMHFRGLLAQ